MDVFFTINLPTRPTTSMPTICQSVYLSIYPFVRPSVLLSVHSSNGLPCWLSFPTSIHSSVCLSVKFQGIYKKNMAINSKVASEWYNLNFVVLEVSIYFFMFLFTVSYRLWSWQPHVSTMYWTVHKWQFKSSISGWRNPVTLPCMCTLLHYV